MPFIFKKKNHKASKPSLLIRSTSGISIGNDMDVLPTLVTPPRGQTRKLRKIFRVLTTRRYDSTTIISVSSTRVGSKCSASNAPPISHRAPIGINIKDFILQPDPHTTIFWQASPNCRDSNERPPNPASCTVPGTEKHSREISLEVPPSTSSQGSISRDKLPAIIVGEVDGEASVMEGITYDAILISTLHKSLGMIEGSTKYMDIPATRTPLAAIQEGGFGSLMGVSMAIMQGRA